MSLVNCEMNSIGLKLTDGYLHEGSVTADNEDRTPIALSVQTVGLEIEEGTGKLSEFLQKLD